MLSHTTKESQQSKESPSEITINVSAVSRTYTPRVNSAIADAVLNILYKQIAKIEEHIII